MTNLLAAYDAQLRGDAEVRDADNLIHIGPATAAVLARGVGFVTYTSLDGVDDVAALIAEVIDHFERHTDVPEFEWKTRGHDQPDNLVESLTSAALEAEPQETIMVGDARLVARAPEISPDIAIRRIFIREDVERALALQQTVFGHPAGSAEAHLKRITDFADESSMWVAEADGDVVGAGRIDIVPGTDFAGVWGGAVLRDFRGQGIYRALVAARAHWAMERGASLIHSDCTDMSRPILERSGLMAITTSTPYIWKRATGSRMGEQALH